MSERVRPRLAAALSFLVVATACGDDLPDPPDALGMSSSGTTSTTGTSTTFDPSSSGTTLAPASSDEGGTTTTTGPTTVGVPDECTMTADCGGGELCVAPFDQSAGPEGKGAYECVSECVAIMDEDRWCADVAACCDPQAECTDRGYCVYADGTGSTEGGGTEGSGTSGGSTGSTG